MRRGSFTSRQIAQSMRATRPVETPDTDAATVYEQRWRRRDGQARAFSVLALDAQMAEEMGGLRIRDKYNQSIIDWTLTSNRPVERITSRIWEVLAAEEPDETKLREEEFFARQSGASV